MFVSPADLKRSHLVFAVLAASLVAPLAAHAESRMAAQAKEYAAKNNLPIRKVMAPGSGKPVERLFVPVLPNTFADLSSRLVETNGGIGIRALAQQHDANGHVGLIIEPGSIYYYGKPKHLETTYPWNATYNSHKSGGYLFGVDFSPEEIAHLKMQMPTIPHYASNCMMWLGQAEVAPNKLFFHALGVTRSKGAGNAIRQKLLRVANDRLQVAGVMVNSLEEFNAMTDAQLLGPAHPNGDAESVHE